MTLEKKTFKPGIYDISNEDYHRSHGISRSGIMEFKRSPKHFWHKYINPIYARKEPTPDFIFGSAFHAYVLEPEKFDKEYVLKQDKRDKLPEVPLLKDVGREAYDNAKTAYETERKRRKQADESFYHFSLGKEVIEQCDFEEIKLMKQSLMNNNQARELILDAHYEKSIFWIDKVTGLTCKARPDIFHPNFIVDLKTTKDASYKAFQRDFYNYGYHLQIAMIHLALKEVTGHSIMNFIDLAVEKEPPYAEAIYPIDETALQAGIDEFNFYLPQIKECFDKNEWPGYKVQTISLPAYAMIGE